MLQKMGEHSLNQGGRREEDKLEVSDCNSAFVFQRALAFQTGTSCFSGLLELAGTYLFC